MPVMWRPDIFRQDRSAGSQEDDRAASHMLLPLLCLVTLKQVPRVSALLDQQVEL